MSAHWSSDDFPDRLESASEHYALGYHCRLVLAEWMNAHHPKPHPEDVTIRELWRARALEAECARDAAIARAERAERELHRARSDQRLAAWDRIADHPFFADCYHADGTLIDAMMEALDEALVIPVDVVDPVEELARELWEASRDTDNDPTWQERLDAIDDLTIENSMDRAFAADDVERMRRLARHQIGDAA